MALSPAINPETITGTKKSNLLRAQNFISGGSSVGAGVLGSAANKIVKFQKAGVQPSPVDISSIVKSISTGVVSNFNNQAQTINNSVTNIISKSIGNFSKDYQDRVKKVDEAKPTGVLQKILGLYRDVIGFIQFFGKRKFVEGLRDNLKALQTSFSESFEVAKLIRQVIIKIVKQLSNLPKTSPSGGGGINLDVDVPGGGLKKSAPRGLNRRMGKGGMLALGAGALGLGAAGAAATNALSDSDAIQPGSPAPEIPGNLLDGLSAIIDRFSKAIDSLVKGSSSKKKSGSSSGSGDGSAGNVEKPKGTPGDTPGATPGASVDETVSPEVDAAGLKSNFAPIAQDILESGKIDSTKLSDRAAMGAMLAVGQMESNYSYDKAYSGMGGGDMNMKGFLQLNQKYHKVSGEKQYLDYTIPKFKGEDVNFTGGGRFNPLIFAKYLKNAKTGSDVANAMKVAGFTVNDFEPLGSVEAANRLSEKQVVAIKKIVFGNINLQNASSFNPKSEVDPAPGTQAQAAQTQAVAQQQQITQVAQPVQQQPKANIITIDMSGGGQQTQQQSPSGGGISAPPSPQQKGPTQPFLPPSNPNNFLTLYSRMVYNIVDG